MGSVRMDLVGQRELEVAVTVDGRGMRIFKPKREFVVSDTGKGGVGGEGGGGGHIVGMELSATDSSRFIWSFRN
jgi:hypothetical protein